MTSRKLIIPILLVLFLATAVSGQEAIDDHALAMTSSELTGGNCWLRGTIFVPLTNITLLAINVTEGDESPTIYLATDSDSVRIANATVTNQQAN